jgi:hypothetical protein
MRTSYEALYQITYLQQQLRFAKKMYVFSSRLRNKRNDNYKCEQTYPAYPCFSVVTYTTHHQTLPRMRPRLDSRTCKSQFSFFASERCSIYVLCAKIINQRFKTSCKKYMKATSSVQLVRWIKWRAWMLCDHASDHSYVPNADNCATTV